MFHSHYEDMVRFASEGRLGTELRQAKAEYIERTGDMFESDASFERRLAAFLEWYVLDRPVSFAPDTPARLYIQAKADKVDEVHRKSLEELTRTQLSLFEYKRARGEHMHVVDLLSGQKFQVFERRKPAGMEGSDILEARLVPFEDKVVFAEAIQFAPRPARRAILKAAKAFRKSSGQGPDRIDLVHRVQYFINRCERYKHVDPQQIFADL